MLIFIYSKWSLENSMNVELVKKLALQDESLFLEFKKIWYWDTSTKDNLKPKCWGELLKDFAALFNVFNNDSSFKYLLVGIDEATKELNDYYGADDTLSADVRDVSELKIELIRRIKKQFNALSSSGLEEVQDIERMFEFIVISVEGKKVLLVKIENAPYLLELKNILTDLKTTTKSGQVIVRKLDKKNEPENAVSSHIETTKMLEIISDKNIPQRSISVRKYVEIFKNNHLPSSAVIEKSSNYSYSNGVCYEVFTINGMFGVIQFIYFSKYTSQNKTARILKDEKLILDTKTIILVDNENKQGSQLDKQRIEKLFLDSIHDVSALTLNEFSNEQLCKDLFDMNIFHQGNFNISDFVQPYADVNNDTTADVLLWEWFNSTDSPLMVIKGLVDQIS